MMTHTSDIKVLGVDQSFTSTGWWFGDDRNGIIKSDQRLDKFTRMKQVADSLLSLCDNLSATHVVLEGLPFMSRSNVTRDLAGLQAVILTTLLERYEVDNTVIIVPPTSLKKYATDSGKATKADMINAIPKEIRDKFTAKGKSREDLADAYWLCSLGYDRFKK